MQKGTYWWIRVNYIESCFIVIENNNRNYGPIKKKNPETKSHQKTKRQSLQTDFEWTLSQERKTRKEKSSREQGLETVGQTILGLC